MITCTRRLQFCAGHRVMGHENKCANLHGHNYVVLLTASAEDLDAVGRVVDFSVLKYKIGDWIQEFWDHGFILNQEDKAGRAALKLFADMNQDGLKGQKLFLASFNPTAENMASHLLRVMGPRLLAGTGVILTKVRVWETENCYADAELDT